MKYLFRLIRIRWINRHFAREINAQLAQYRQYKKLLNKPGVDPDDAEFYLYEMSRYRDLVSERAGIDPDKVRRFRIR